MQFLIYQTYEIVHGHKGEWYIDTAVSSVFTILNQKENIFQQNNKSNSF